MARRTRRNHTPAFKAQVALAALKLFKRLKARRVACLSYRKYAGDDWSPEEFVDATIELRRGQQVRMRLAERGTLLGGVVWVREIRKVCDTGRQVALISTDYQSGIGRLAATLFARWSQENFFKYAREHFALDRLVDYTEIGNKRL